MADLSNPLTQIVVGQAQPAVTANELIDALSPAAIFGRNAETSAGLVWGYYGGRYRGIAIAHGTETLTANEANLYIVAAKATGVVSFSTGTTNWNDSTNYDRLYWAMTGATTITDWDDYREVVSSAGAGVATIDTETIQDIIASLIVAGPNVTKQYNDGDSPATLVLSAAAGATPLTQENVEDIVGALITAGSGISLNYNDGDSPATLSISAAATPLTQENVEDIAASLITVGTGLSKQYNDGDSPATVAITLDADLVTIAGLTATSDNFIQSKSSAWASRTVAQVTTDLQSTGLVAGAVGFREVPSNSRSAAYTTVAADSGKSIDHPSTDANARTFTIDSNANVAYPDGTCISFSNMTSNVVTIAITSDTMYLAGAGTTGSRSLAQYGLATARKLTSTTWLISGTGLT